MCSSSCFFFHPSSGDEREERETVSLLLPLDVYTWWWIGYGNGV
jgi:hypothetical protein